MKLPNLFIVGAPKCGTTSIYEYLSQHPDVFMSPIKEPQFYNTDKKYNRDSQENYYKLFVEANSEKYLGEASPMYLYSKAASENIKALHSNAKIIIMLRRPADIVYSMYHQNLKNGVETAKSFQRALDLEEVRKKGELIPNNYQDVERLYYSEYPKYEQHIRRYINTFGEENVFIKLFDELNENTEKVVSEICNFLDINPDFKYQNVIYNKAKQNRLNWLHRLYKYPPNSVKKISRFFFNEKQRANLYKTFVRFNQKEFEKEKMDKSIEQKINADNYTETEFLEQLLQKDLSHWK